MEKLTSSKQIKGVFYYPRSTEEEEKYVPFDTKPYELQGMFHEFDKTPNGTGGVPQKCVWLSYRSADKEMLCATWMEMVLAGNTSILREWVATNLRNRAYTSSAVSNAAIQQVETYLEDYQDDEQLQMEALKVEKFLCACGVKLTS